MRQQASAYLSIFDDWHLLGAAMDSIAARVDEIVVVDGAYRWMAPFLQAEGRDPARSNPRVEAALAPFADKVRWVRAIWANELEKRAAGYAACRHRYVYRVDADEMLFFDETALARFFADGCAVAEMEMPIAVTPDLVRGRPGKSFERTALLFDREKVGAMAHLAYVWLVLPPGEQAKIGPRDGALVFGTPVAFTAHLTHWRPPGSAVNRARFYVLNYLRHGHPTGMAPGVRFTEAAGFADLMKAVPASVLREQLLGHAIVAGAPALDGAELVSMPPVPRALFTPFYDRYLAGLAALNANLAERPRAVACGEYIYIDVSTAACRVPFETAGGWRLLFSVPLAAAQVELLTLLPHSPWETCEAMPFTIDQTGIILTPSLRAGALRLTLRVIVWSLNRTVFINLAAPVHDRRAAVQDGLI